MSVYRSLTVEILKATYSKVGTESKAGVALFSRICLETSDLGDEPPRVYITRREPHTPHTPIKPQAALADPPPF
jgi:hypothetical protein